MLAAPFHRHLAPYDSLVRHVDSVFTYLRRRHYNRHRRAFQQTFLGMSNQAVVDWLQQHEDDPFYHPYVEHLALKVLKRRGLPMAPELSEALSSMGLVDPTVLFQTS